MRFSTLAVMSVANYHLHRLAVGVEDRVVAGVNPDRLVA